MSVSVCLLDTTASCANTAEPIQMPFGMWTRLGPMNHVLGGDPDQGGYIFYAGGSLAGAGYCRQCRRRPAILLL